MNAKRLEDDRLESDIGLGKGHAYEMQENHMYLTFSPDLESTS